MGSSSPVVSKGIVIVTYSSGEIYAINLSNGQVIWNDNLSTLIQKKVSLPAYDQCLKASHVFNILDARGVISVAQRAEYISKIRDLTKAIGKVWLESQD